MDLPGPAAQQDHLPVNITFEEPDKDTSESDPDPRCVDLDPRGHDAQLDSEDNSMPIFLNETIFENTCLKDLLTAIDFIWALQPALHDDAHCKMDQNSIQWLRNPPSTPFNISLLPDLCMPWPQPFPH